MDKKKLSFKDIIIIVLSFLIITFQVLILIGQYNNSDDVKKAVQDVNYSLVGSNVNRAYSDNTNQIVNTYDYTYLYFNTSLTKTQLHANLTQFETITGQYPDDTYYLWYNGSNYVYCSYDVNTSSYELGYRYNGRNYIVYDDSRGWLINDNPVQVILRDGLEEFTEGGVTYQVGDVNVEFVDIVSSTPFLFQNTSLTNYSSTGLVSSDISYIYLNNTLTNNSIKSQFDLNGGYFDYTIGVYDEDNDVTHTLQVYNSPTQAYIKFDYEYVYLYDWFNYSDNWFIGYNPEFLNYDVLMYGNNLTITYPALYDSIKFNFILSENDDFAVRVITEQDLIDAFNQGRLEGYNEGRDAGYEDGYQAGLNSSTGGYDNGFNDGKNSILSNPNQYGLYDSSQMHAEYNKGLNDAQGVEEKGFKILFNSIMNAPFNILNGILNFEIFGINLFSLFSFIFTLVLIGFIVKIFVSR